MVSIFGSLKDYVLKAAESVQDEALEVVSAGVESLAGKVYRIGSGKGMPMYEVVDVGVIQETAKGSISVARCVDTKEVFALKRIVCGGKNGFVTLKQLEDADFEMQLTGQLAPHPNIPRCYGACMENTKDGHLKLLLLEYCDGGSLEDFLEGKSAGEIPDDEICDVLLHVGRALHHLHTQPLPIEHRKVTPKHIVWSNRQEQWKLCDFGSVATKVGPEDLDYYDEAEQELIKELESLHPDVRDRPPESIIGSGLPFLPMTIDVWMLGCILYRMLFGRNPFLKNDRESLLMAKLEVPVWAAMTPAGGKLCILLHWLLARDPRSRPTASRLTGLLDKWGMLKPQSLLYLCPADVRHAVRETLSASERRVMLDWVMARNEGNLSGDMLGALNELQSVPLSELRKVVPKDLAKKIERLRKSYGSAGSQPPSTFLKTEKLKEKPREEAANVDSALNEIDSLLDDLEFETEDHNSDSGDDADDIICQDLLDWQNSLSKVQKEEANQDLLTFDDDACDAEWAAQSAENRTQTIETLSALFGDSTVAVQEVGRKDE